MLGEFALIAKYFAGHDTGKGVRLGVGDDCALLHSKAPLALTTDTLVEGSHFFAGTRADFLGWRALAVNISDLAAMGAKPRYFLLSLTLPEAKKAWLKAFAKGLFALARQEKMALIGGNTSKGPLSITITAIGSIKPQRVLLRNAAKPGDDIYVTGSLGGAGLYVKAGQGELKLSSELFNELYAQSFLLPSRARFARKLTRICNCAIDISDGLTGDLRHICRESKVGAQLILENLPLNPCFALPEVTELLSREARIDTALYGGCDYELLFTLAPAQRAALQQLACKLQVPVTKIGTITPLSDGFNFMLDGRRQILRPSFEHF